jgi:hypothetical protein
MRQPRKIFRRIIIPRRIILHAVAAIVAVRTLAVAMSAAAVADKTPGVPIEVLIGGPVLTEVLTEVPIAVETVVRIAAAADDGVGAVDAAAAVAAPVQVTDQETGRAILLRKTPDRVAIFPHPNMLPPQAVATKHAAEIAASNKAILNLKVATRAAVIRAVVAIAAARLAVPNLAAVNRAAKAPVSIRLLRPTIRSTNPFCFPGSR